MTNKAAIHNAVQCARAANNMAIYYAREARFYPSSRAAAFALEWLESRAAHMNAARQLKQDAQQ